MSIAGMMMEFGFGGFGGGDSDSDDDIVDMHDRFIGNAAEEAEERARGGEQRCKQCLKKTQQPVWSCKICYGNHCAGCEGPKCKTCGEKVACKVKRQLYKLDRVKTNGEYCFDCIDDCAGCETVRGRDQLKACSDCTSKFCADCTVKCKSCGKEHYVIERESWIGLGVWKSGQCYPSLHKFCASHLPFETVNKPLMTLLIGVSRKRSSLHALAGEAELLKSIWSFVTAAKPCFVLDMSECYRSTGQKNHSQCASCGEFHCRTCEHSCSASETVEKDVVASLQNSICSSARSTLSSNGASSSSQTKNSIDSLQFPSWIRPFELEARVRDRRDLCGCKFSDFKRCIFPISDGRVIGLQGSRYGCSGDQSGRTAYILSVDDMRVTRNTTTGEIPSGYSGMDCVLSVPTRDRIWAFSKNDDYFYIGTDEIVTASDYLDKVLPRGGEKPTVERRTTERVVFELDVTRGVWTRAAVMVDDSLVKLVDDTLLRSSSGRNKRFMMDVGGSLLIITDPTCWYENNGSTGVVMEYDPVKRALLPVFCSDSRFEIRNDPFGSSEYESSTGFCAVDFRSIRPSGSVKTESEKKTEVKGILFSVARNEVRSYIFEKRNEERNGRLKFAASVPVTIPIHVINNSRCAEKFRVITCAWVPEQGIFALVSHTFRKPAELYLLPWNFSCLSLDAPAGAPSTGGWVRIAGNFRAYTGARMIVEKERVNIAGGRSYHEDSSDDGEEIMNSAVVRFGKKIIVK